MTFNMKSIMALKIATGTLKGCTLLSTTSVRELRPTQAKVREALINIIRATIDNDFEDSKALDLFAGIGTIGFEFLSNDFKEVVFFEQNSNCINLIKKNAIKLKLADKLKAFKAPLPQGLKDFKKHCLATGTFDLVFLDPPYKFSKLDYINTIAALFKLNFMSLGALLIIETDKKDLDKPVIESFPEDLVLVKKKDYGDTFLYFLKFVDKKGLQRINKDVD